MTPRRPATRTPLPTKRRANSLALTDLRRGVSATPQMAPPKPTSPPAQMPVESFPPGTPACHNASCPPSALPYFRE